MPRMDAGDSGFLIFESNLDNAVGQTLFTFEQAKGGGKANHNRTAINCTTSETGVLGDYLEPGETPPPGTSVHVR